jgi:hypothetical protein
MKQTNTDAGQPKEGGEDRTEKRRTGKGARPATGTADYCAQVPPNGFTEVIVTAGMFALAPEAIVDPVLEPVEEPGEEPGVPAGGVEPVVLLGRSAPGAPGAPGLYEVFPEPAMVPVTSTRWPTYCFKFWSLPPDSLYVLAAIRPAPDVPVPAGPAPVADPVVEPGVVAEPVVDPGDVLPAPEVEPLVEAFVRM